MQQPKWRDRSLPITVLLGTGIRVGELLALTWDNIDLKQKQFISKKRYFTYGIQICKNIRFRFNPRKQLTANAVSLCQRLCIMPFATM